MVCEIRSFPLRIQSIARDSEIRFGYAVPSDPRQDDQMNLAEESIFLHACSSDIERLSQKHGWPGLWINSWLQKPIERELHGLSAILVFAKEKATKCSVSHVNASPDFQKRDWGYAPEYVESVWTMLQKERPDDYVLGTGESHTIREFVTEAFEYVGLDWRKHVFIDDRYKRPAEVDFLLADPKKAERELAKV